MLNSVLTFSLFTILCLSGLFYSIIGLWNLSKETNTIPSIKIHSFSFPPTFHVISATVLIGFWLFFESYVRISTTINSPWLDANHLCHSELIPPALNTTLPFDNAAIILIMVPIVFSTIFKNKVSLNILLTSWLITVLWLIICVIAFKAYNSIFAVILYAILSFAILYQNQLHHDKLCNIIVDKTNEIMEVKKEAESMKSEQQNMVSNVAHDLKTVRIYFYFTFIYYY